MLFDHAGVSEKERERVNETRFKNLWKIKIDCSRLQGNSRSYELQFIIENNVNSKIKPAGDKLQCVVISHLKPKCVKLYPRYNKLR